LEPHFFPKITVILTKEESPREAQRRSASLHEDVGSNEREISRCGSK